MIKIKSIVYSYIYILLLTPILAYIYTVGFSFPKTITQFFVIFTSIFGVVLLFFVNKRNFYIPNFIKVFFIFAVYRIIWLYFYDLNVNPITLIYYYNKDISVILLLLLIYNTHFDKKFYNKVIFIFKWTIVISVLVSLMQAINLDFLNANNYFKGDYKLNDNIYQFRRASIYGFIDPNALGIAFLPIYSLYLGHILFKNKNFVLPIIVGAGIVSLLSNTRYIMAGFVLVSIQVYIFNIKIQEIIKQLFLFGIGFMVLIYSLQYIGYDFEDWYNQRLLSEGSLEETSRYKAIDSFLFFFPKNPILGVGGINVEIKSASQSVGSSQIHVGYFSALVYYGIIGAGLMFVFWIQIIRKFYNTAKLTKNYGPLFGFLVFVWANATLVMFDLFYYGLLFTFVFDKYYLDKYKTESINRNKPLNNYAI